MSRRWATKDGAGHLPPQRWLPVVNQDVYSESPATVDNPRAARHSCGKPAATCLRRPTMTRRHTRRQVMQGMGVAGLGLLAGCGRWPGQQRAPGGPEIRRIGVLGDSSTARWDAFREGLRELGWVEGQNLAVEYRWTEGNNERYGAVAAELVQLQVELIVAGAETASVAAKQATSAVPIVAILSTGGA